MRKLIFLIPILWALGCNAPAPTPPLVPDPPQVQVLKLVQAGATANNTAAKTLVVLCVPNPPAVPALDATTCSNTAEYLRMAARIFEQVKTEAGSTDAWSVMRGKILDTVSAAALDVTVPDPILRLQIIEFQDALRQILEVK